MLIGRWQGDGSAPMTERAPRLDEATWALATRGAAQLNYSVATYVRMALTWYVGQDEREPRPASMKIPGGGVFHPARSLRTDDALWARVASRARKDRTTMAGVVASAIVWARRRQDQDQHQDRVQGSAA